MPEQPALFAVDLKELLRRVFDSKTRRAELVRQRADSSAGPTTSEVERYRHFLVAERAVREELAIQFGTHSGTPTAWELTVQILMNAISHRDGKPRHEDTFGKVLENYCRCLKGGTPPQWDEGEEHMNALQREGFTRELWKELWKHCQGEAKAELKLPELTRADGGQGGENGGSMGQRIEVKDSPGATVNQFIGSSNHVSQNQAKEGLLQQIGRQLLRWFSRLLSRPKKSKGS